MRRWPLSCRRRRRGGLSLFHDLFRFTPLLYGQYFIIVPKIHPSRPRAATGPPYRACRSNIRGNRKPPRREESPFLGDGGEQKLHHPGNRNPLFRPGLHPGRAGHPAERPGEREIDVSIHPVHLLRPYLRPPLDFRPGQVEHEPDKPPPYGDGLLRVRALRRPGLLDVPRLHLHG